MKRRYFVAAGLLATLTIFLSTAVSAQVGELRGRILMQTTDGTVPAANAAIDVYRTDMIAKYQTRTDKKGHYVFAGLPYAGTYIVAVSAPNATPTWAAGVKAGREASVDLTLTPGDGKRFTLEEIRAASGEVREENASAQAAREELAKKNAEIEASNKKITEANEIIARTFSAGNAALVAAAASSSANAPAAAIQQYTTAIAEYDEGLGADANQPAILTNKAVALKGRGSERFNMAVGAKTMDGAVKAAALQSAKDDFKAAAGAAGRSVALMRTQVVPTNPTEIAASDRNRYAALLTYAESMRLYVSKVDPAQVEIGRKAFKDYIAVESDPAKRAKAQLDMAQMLLDAGAGDEALAEFRTILIDRPDSPEANLGAGLAIYAAGDHAKLQQAANYLQHFVDVAPDTNPLKAGAKAILLELKASENISPTVKKPS